MSDAENAKIAKTVFDNLNAHNLDANYALESPDLKAETPGALASLTRDQDHAYTQNFLTAFPDLHWDVRQTVAQGDFVVLNWVGTGTHTGPLTSPSGASVPPTGKKASVPGSNTFEIKGGKVTHIWVYFDMAGLLGQLGLMPPM